MCFGFYSKIIFRNNIDKINIFLLKCFAHLLFHIIIPAILLQWSLIIFVCAYEIIIYLKIQLITF